MLRKRKFTSILQLKAADCRGWSMVEIVTVMVIIFIAAAFAAPDIIQWGENTRVTSAARDFIADLNEAKVSAIQMNSTSVVDITTGDASTGVSSYTIFTDNGEGTGTAGDKSQDGDEATLSTRDFTDDEYRGAYIISTSITSPLLTFTARGIPEDNSSREILISNDDKDIWLKIIVASSGALTLLKSVDSTDGSDGTWN